MQYSGYLKHRASMMVSLAALLVAASCGTDELLSQNDASSGATGGADTGEGGAAGAGADDGGAAAAGGADPYSGSAVVVPGLVEAEAFVAAFELNQDFDESDESCLNAVDPTVDILELEDGSGCSIGYTGAGEWTEYDIYVPRTGAYDFELAVATAQPARVVSVSVDGVERGTVAVPNVDWNVFQAAKLEQVSLAAGEHRVRIGFATGATNLDYFRVLAAGDCISDCGDDECGNDQCGNTCGACADGETCTASRACLDAAECAATCGDMLCGTNPCGISCGECPEGTVCTPTGTCFDPSVTPVARFGQLSVAGNKIVGENGSPAQLKGVSTHWLNWEKAYSSSRPALTWMRDNWGLSVFRIANGVENSGGYLLEPTERMALVKTIIDNAIASDVYAIVDWHTHEIEHVDEAKAFFAEIAQTYGDQPHVIYEVFNEPVRQDWATEVKPYHEELVAEIRKHDPDNIILLGTPNWSQRVDQAAAQPVAGDNLAYVLHFYACTHGATIRAHGQTALDAGLAVFVSEWGGTNADGGTSSNPGICEAQVREWHQWMEANDIGWAAWKLSTDGDDSAFLRSTAPLEGGWTDEHIKGHGPLVRELMTDEL